VGYPNGTKPSGGGVERIISLGLRLSIAQKLVFAQNNVCAVSSTFGQRNTIPDSKELIQAAQNAEKCRRSAAWGATVFHAS
jgi:hypothetical protein